MARAKRRADRSTPRRVIDSISLPHSIEQYYSAITGYLHGLDTDISHVQIEPGSAPLFDESGQSVELDDRGIIVIDRIPAKSTITLYRSPERAERQDTTACPPGEQRRTMIEEAKRLVWQKLQHLRGRDP